MRKLAEAYIAYFIRKIKFFIRIKKNKVFIAPGSYINPYTDIGRYTRINQISHIEKCRIGACCAIGGRLVIRDTNHYTNFLNMQDWFQRSLVRSRISVAGKANSEVVVGNGVWLGDSVIILPGVKIGDGAVIGAGSVVTKDIPPYAVAAGNPARVLRYRFSVGIINILEKIDWWNWDIASIRARRRIFETDMETTSAKELDELLRDLGIENTGRGI